MTFDGYARLHSKHVPEQTAGTTTVYAYNNDDGILSVTDARGASATYGYNNRHLVTSITYNAPQGITPTPNVTFEYDAVGNRTSMDDGLGTHTYNYNQLSRLTSETRGFTGLDDFTLSYDYNLAGQVKSITDPVGSRVDYAFDTAGRFNNITGANYDVSQFLPSATYRASGAVKQASYGNGRTLSLTYNQRLQVSHLEMPMVMNFDYQFYADGSLKYSHDVIDQRFDRAYEYDHAARLKRGLSGAEARGEPPTDDRPYFQTFTRDAFDHLTNRVTKHWSNNTPYISVDSYTNNRRNGWSYDADGNLTDNLARQYAYDAVGRISFVSGSSLNQYFDGDGQRVKTVEPNLTTHYIRSTVLGGQVIAELDGSGSRLRGFVYQGTKLLAEQWSNGQVVFAFADASSKSIRYTDSQAGTAFIFNELDPVGAESEREDPYPEDPDYTGRGEGGALFPGFGNITHPSTGCTLDGVYALCEWIERGMRSGAVEIQITMSDLTTKSFPIREFGLGLYGIWIEDEGRKLDSRQTQAGDYFDQFDTIVTNTDSDGLGHLEFVALSFSPQNPASNPNPNCIANAVAGGTLGTTRGLIPRLRFVPGRGGVPTGTASHDGIHVYAPPGDPADVTALPAMAGQILWGNRQGELGDPDYNLGIMDIRLNTRINGQQYVMTLKDLNYSDMQRSGTVRPGSVIGTVNGADDRVGETGLHVTLMPYSIYQRYVVKDVGRGRRRPTVAGRRSVPFGSLMDAARNPNSTFRCP